MRIEELDRLVWDEVKRLLRNPDEILRYFREQHENAAATTFQLSQRKLQEFERQLGTLRKQERRLVNAYEAEVIELAELKERRAAIERRREELQGEAGDGGGSVVRPREGDVPARRGNRVASSGEPRRRCRRTKRRPTTKARGDTPTHVRELVSAGSVWRYTDDGRDPGTSWRDPGHDDSRWAELPAPLGYGDPVATVIGVPAEPDDQPATTYFRHTFSVDATDRFSTLTIHLRRDDGAAVYLNGVEVVRDGLPEEADHETLGERTVVDEDQFRYFRFDVRPEHLRSGSNVIAVEVHQSASTTSPDLSFDLVLEGRVEPE